MAVNSNVEYHYCIKCKDDNKDTLLYYSKPAKDSDTWTKRLENKSDYRCKQCVKKDNHTNRKSRINTDFKNKHERIEQYHRNKTIEFEKMWNDPIIKELPEPERLMEALRLYNIRGQDNDKYSGYTAEEMAEIIRYKESNFSASAYVEQWDQDNKDRLNRYEREKMKIELIKVLLEFEEGIRINNRKLVVNSVRNLIEAANILYYGKKEIFEKIVTTPGHRDPTKNSAARFHLLTTEETLRLREARKKKQMISIESTIEKEKRIHEQVKKQLVKDKEEQEIKGTENNDSSRINESN